MASSMGVRRLLFSELALIILLAHAFATASGTTPEQPPSRIAVLHMYNGAGFFRRLGALSGENKARYAARHGYDFVFRSPFAVRGLFKPTSCAPGNPGPCWAEDTDFDIDATRRPTFGKLKLTLAACNNRPNAWILWSDADALIINQTVPLESIIDDGYDLMISYDWLMVQAGVILFKCSPWTLDFVGKVYNDREFDKARALDQSAIQSYLDKLSNAERDQHVKVIPKYVFNVYPEEYRPGDFLVHMAGKLYEATEAGAWAIASQFDVLSTVEDIHDIRAFFDTRYLFNRFSGVCAVEKNQHQKDCKPHDERRLKLKEPLGAMSKHDRYRHVGMRYYFLKDWSDKYDVPGWDTRRKILEPVSRIENGRPRVPPVFEGLVAHDKDAEQPHSMHMTAPHLELDESQRGDQAQGHEHISSPTTHKVDSASKLAVVIAVCGALVLWAALQQRKKHWRRVAKEL